MDKKFVIETLKDAPGPLNIIALTKVLEVARRVRDENLPFDMKNWMIQTWHNKVCTTEACVIGWCTRDEWFRKVGLSLGHYLTPEYNGLTFEMEALRCFFGISISSVLWLFYPEQYGKEVVTIDMVIERLEDFLLEAEIMISNGTREPLIYPQEL